MDRIREKVALFDARTLVRPYDPQAAALEQTFGTPKKAGTMAYRILQSHDTYGAAGENVSIRFDALCSHDITYVGIIQTARVSGMERFPVKYVLTNCHNSLCAVGGTINEDDHAFGLSAAKRYGGDFVPPHLAVIHSYMRECEAAPYKMILGSDSHTRYGAFGTLGVGEGGPELAKQLMGATWDAPAPEVICVYLKGSVPHGVGPQDVALAIIKEVYDDGFVKNKIMEFVGPGVAGLSMEFRSGIDVMTTETRCLSSVWVTDEVTRRAMETLKRSGEYRPLAPAPAALYDGALVVDLSEISPMIALPFHPSNAYTIREFSENASEILNEIEENSKKVLGENAHPLGLKEKLRGGKFYCDQAIVAGCAGGSFENLALCANILNGAAASEIPFSVYPGSMPIALDLARKGVSASLMASGAVLKTAFCGPCFGAGDTPQNRGFSIRHTTRNFPLREGAKPGEGQIASVALMDARSIAATVRMGGVLTGADMLDYSDEIADFSFDPSAYEKKVYHGWGKPDASAPLVIGPNITDWPPFPALTDDLLLEIASVIEDPVTTTDELIPSGETSSLRSNPEKLSRFALSRRDPEYVGRALKVRAEEEARRNTGALPERLQAAYEACRAIDPGFDAQNTIHATAIFACRPGDGSAREQAASCQKVLGGSANFALGYATKRYRSNLINWGMLPFVIEENVFQTGDLVYVPALRKTLSEKADTVRFYRIRNGASKAFFASLGELSEKERQILLCGCLMNYYKELKKERRN